MTLAPRSDCDGVDCFIVRAFDEMHTAILTHQVAGFAQRVFFRSKGSTNAVPVQSTIEIVRGPVHAVLCEPPGPSQPVARGFYLTFRFIADSLPRLLSISYSTTCPSLSAPRPARSTALMCTNTSLPPPPCG